MAGHPVVYLHIGAPKTGTTFLQGVLWANRNALAAEGVGLPGHGQEDHFQAGFDLREVNRDPEDPRPAWTGAWDAFAEDVRQSDARVMVISDERLAAASAKQADRAVASLSPAEVHIVYTIRDLARVLPAEWQEYVKHLCPDRFDEWLSAVLAEDPAHRKRPWFWRVHDADAVLRRWSGSVPPDRVHLITVPTPGSPPELLWGRFASLLGIDPRVADPGAVQTNASLNLNETELLRRVNVALPRDFSEWHHITFVREFLANQVLAARPRGRPLALPAETLPSVRTSAERVVSRLRESDYHVVGDLDELIPNTRARQGVEPVAADASEVLDASVEAIAELVQHMGSMGDSHRRQVTELEARVRELQEDVARRREDPLRWCVRDLSERNRLVRAARVARWRLIESFRRFARRG